MATHEKEAKKPKTEKAPKSRRVLTPKEQTALIIGLLAALLAVLGVVAMLWLSGLVGAILGGIGVLGGFVSLMCGKGGTLPSMLAIVAGFLTVLSYLVTIQLT